MSVLMITQFQVFCYCSFRVKVKGLTEVNGFRSVFSSSDLSNTRVTGPGSRSPNNAFCTGTLQYLSMQTPNRFCDDSTDDVQDINK